MATDSTVMPGWCKQTISMTYTLAIYAGLLSLAGLTAESLLPTRVVFTWLYLQPNVAVCFILCGWALYLLRNRMTTSFSKILASCCITVVLLISVITIIEYIYQLDFHLEKMMLHKQTPDELFLYSTHMSISEIVNFILICTALLILMTFKKPRLSILVISFIIFSISMLVLFGYTYRVMPTYSLIHHTRMPLITTVLFMMFSAALPLVNTNSNLITVLIGNNAAGKSARRILAYIIIIPIVISYLENLGEVYNLYNPDFGDTLLSTTSLMLIMIVIAINSKIIYDEEQMKVLTEKELEYVTYNDKATGLLNRYGFEEALINILDAANSHLIAVFKLDLNQADLINHVAGFEAGNLLLRQLAERYSKASFLRGATIGLIGSHRFGFIISGANRITEISEIANQLLALTSQTSIVNGKNMVLSSSLGISIYPDDGKTAEALLLSGDAALNLAKKQSGNSFQFCTSNISYAMTERLEIENALQFAVEENQLQLYYQPQLDLKTGKISGAETLLRWLHPKKGFIMPSTFISIAEETGLIVSIGEWILRETCKQIKQGFLPSLQKQGCDTIPLAVNLSSAQFNERYPIVTIFQNIIKEYEINPNAIELEITESLLLQDTQTNLKRIADFKKIGFKIAIDDFGTGYSSFSYISRIPNDLIKIDKSFIDRLPNNKNDVDLVRAIIAMFHQLGKKVIAEGVENVDQLEFLKDADCDYIQGNYYSPAISLEEFKVFLQTSA